MSDLSLGELEVLISEIFYRGNFEELGNYQYTTSTTDTCKFQLNYQGIGLPHYAYDRVIGLLLRAGFTSPYTDLPDFTCDSDKCILQRSCENYDWSLAFKFTLTNPYDTYGKFTAVSLASFAVDNLEDGTCNLYIQNLGYPSDQPVIFGSLFLQNFVAYFENDYETMTQSLTLNVSPTSVMPLTYTGEDADTTNQSPFNNIVFPIDMVVTINENFTPTVKANTDFNGWYDFKISLDSTVVSTYSDYCVGYVDQEQIGPCSEVYNTVDQFPTVDHNAMDYVEFIQDGIEATYNKVFSNFCLLESKNENAFCSVSAPGYMYVATTVQSNNWSRSEYQGAGLIGFNLDYGTVKQMLDYQFEGLTL